MKSQPPLLIHALTVYQRMWQNLCLEGKTDDENSEYSLRSKSIEYKSCKQAILNFLGLKRRAARNMRQL